MSNKYKDLIVISNRKLCNKDYFEQLNYIFSLNPNSFILREKDLNEEDYSNLTKKVKDICEKYNVDMYIHSHLEIAKELNINNIHVSIPYLKSNKDNLGSFKKLSVSCHSIEDMNEAVKNGATQILLGNIFETDCKKGLPGKGLKFLKEVCDKCPIPVYAIGGISLENLNDILKAGAAGGCMMSGFMRLK